MNIPAFADAGRFMRGNLHTHSTNSDGRLSPAAICALYRSLGYDFISLTDHFLERYGFPISDTREFRTPEFTTLPGAELHTGYAEFGQLWHILAVGLPFDFAPYPEGETGPQAAARAIAAGAFVAAAHPSWYNLTEADILSLGAIHAIEVYNGTVADDNDRSDSLAIWDQLLMRGKRYFACANDDAHCTAERYDVGRGWVQVKCAHREPEAILDALRRGAYYSSTGPAIEEIGVSGNTLRITCSPAERIFVTGAASASRSARGDGLRQAEFDLSAFRNSPYVRVTVRDHRGGRAWSNPLEL